MPTTFPSHCSIFFGTWPRVLGTASNYTNIPGTTLPYLPALMKKAGYNTAAFISAYHLGMNLKVLPGFDSLSFPPKEFSADITLGRARQWLLNHGRSRFFLWIHLFDPHSPYDLHAEAMKKINPGFDDDFEKRYGFVPPDFYSTDKLMKMVDLYDNEIAFMDEQLGRFMESLRDQPFFNNTVILVAADHGETLDELVKSQNYAFDHGEYLFDDQLHVPLILLLPEKQKAGLRISGSVSLIDLFPTLLELAEIKHADPVNGISLMRFALQDPKSFSDELVFLQRRDYRFPPLPFLAHPQYGVRDRNFKLLWNGPDRNSVLLRNRQENLDLSEKEPRVKEALSNRLQKWLRVTATHQGPKGQPVSEEEADKLRSLGYVQ